MAIGVTGNVESLGLNSLGIRVDRGFIQVNDFMQTSVDNIFALEASA